MRLHKSLFSGKRRAAAIVLGVAASGGAVAGHAVFVGAWGLAVAETVINTGFVEGCPIETADGLSLVIASNRSDNGVNDIWAADRAAIDSSWGDPRKLDGPINSAASDYCPTPVDRSLYFVSERDGGCGGGGGSGDIYLSRQSPVGGWSEPVHLGCAPDGPNTSGPERSPSYVDTWFGTYLYYSSNGGAGDSDIYVSKMRRDGTFGPGKPVATLNSELDDFMPNVRPRERGGFEIVFNSSRPTWGRHNASAYGSQDVYTSYAWLPTGPWASPINLGENVNTAGAETRATISGDGRRLHFGRDGDIYVSYR